MLVPPSITKICGFKLCKGKALRMSMITANWKIWIKKGTYAQYAKLSKKNVFGNVLFRKNILMVKHKFCIMNYQLKNILNTTLDVNDSK